MAYAGTPAGLAQQTGSSPWKTLLAAIAVLAIGLATVIAVMFIGTRAVAPTADRSYDQIEAQRGATSLAGASVTSTAAAVEKAAAAKARAMSGVPAAVDKSQDAIETARGAFAADAVRQTAIEKAAAAKASAMSGVPAAVQPYQVDERPRGAAPVYEPRGAHGPLP